MTAHGEVTRLLRSAHAGERAALDQVFAIVYDELRQVARRQLRRERDGALRPTELVNELYLKLADQPAPDLASRAQFFGIAARAMRQLLIDLARRRDAAKRGGAWVATTLDDAAERALAIEADFADVLALEDALAALDERPRAIVELRFFAGLGEAEVAETLGLSLRTVQREWLKARARLYLMLYGERPSGTPAGDARPGRRASRLPAA